MPQVLVRAGKALWREREGGELRLAELDGDVRPLGHPQRVVARFGELRKKCPHFGGRLQVVLGALEAEPLFVVHGRARLHAKQGVVGQVVFTGRCSGCRWWPAAARQYGGRFRRAAGWFSVCFSRPWSCSSTNRLSLPNISCNRAAWAVACSTSPRKSAWLTSPPRQPVVAITPSWYLLQQLPVAPRLVPITRKISLRGQFEEVFIALVVLRQQGQVVIKLVPLVGVPAGVVEAPPPQRPLEPALGRHVRLDADDRLYPGCTGGLVEVQDPVHVAVVGDGDGGLAVCGRPLHDLLDPRRAIEHRELRMEVQVRKRCANWLRPLTTPPRLGLHLPARTSPSTMDRHGGFSAGLCTSLCGYPVDKITTVFFC